MDSIKIWTLKDIEHNKKDRQERLFALMETGFRNMEEIEKTVSKYDKLEIITSTDIQYLKRLLLKLREEERIILHIFNATTENFVLKEPINRFKDLISEVVLRIELLEEKEKTDYATVTGCKDVDYSSLLLSLSTYIKGMSKEAFNSMLNHKKLPNNDTPKGVWLKGPTDARIFAEAFELEEKDLKLCMVNNKGNPLIIRKTPDRAQYKTNKLYSILEPHKKS